MAGDTRDGSDTTLSAGSLRQDDALRGAAGFENEPHPKYRRTNMTSCGGRQAAIALTSCWTETQKEEPMETNVKAEVRPYGVSVNGAVLTWEQLEAAMMALADATGVHGLSGAGKVKGTRTKFSPYAQEHFKVAAGMFTILKYDNQ